MSDLKTIAEALVGHCRAGTEREALKTLYAEDAVSVEAYDGDTPRETRGLDGLNGKHDWWDANFETHSADASDPKLHMPDRFSVIFRVDATDKSTGERVSMEEVALYTVKDSKIVREEFFY